MRRTLTNEERSKLIAERDQAEFAKKANAAKKTKQTNQDANIKEHRLTTSTKGQFCDPSKKDSRKRPVNDCETKFVDELKIIFKQNKDASQEFKSKIVDELNDVLKDLIPKKITGANFKTLLDNTVSFEDFFGALITNKYLVLRCANLLIVSL